MCLHFDPVLTEKFKASWAASDDKSLMVGWKLVWLTGNCRGLQNMKDGGAISHEYKAGWNHSNRGSTELTSTEKRNGSVYCGFHIMELRESLERYFGRDRAVLLRVKYRPADVCAIGLFSGGGRHIVVVSLFVEQQDWQEALNIARQKCSGDRTCSELKRKAERCKELK